MILDQLKRLVWVFWKREKANQHRPGTIVDQFFFLKKFGQKFKVCKKNHCIHNSLAAEQLDLGEAQRNRALGKVNAAHEHVLRRASADLGPSGWAAKRTFVGIQTSKYKQI